ncbi:MAG: DUF4349 domain-containing protein [Acidimicrobiales bacterium]
MGKSTGTGRKWKLALFVTLLFALVAAACGGDDDSSDAASGAMEDVPADEATSEEFARAAADDSGDATTLDAGAEASQAVADVEEPEQESGAGAEAGNPDTSGVQPSTAGRSIIFVASLEVTVDDVSLAASMAKTQIAGLGGLLFGEDTQKGERDRTVLQFKVLPEDFQEALNRLEGLGELESQQISADDVTERVVDLQSRITTSEVSVARLQDLLAASADLESVAKLEAQLLQRETDLEVLRGQLRTIQDQVDLATIFLTLNETAPPEVEAIADFEVTLYDGRDEGARCPGSDELSVDEGEDFTICVQVTNVGNAVLTEIEVRDEGLGLRPRDFVFVDNAGERPLAPGQQLTAWTTLSAPASGNSRIRLTAVAVDGTGESLRASSEFVLVDDYAVRFVEDDSLPGFLDALSASLDFLVLLVMVAILVAGALLPFIWVPFAIWGLRVWWLRRGSTSESTTDDLVDPGDVGG